MRLQENIDFTTLTWVKPELDETLRQARNALQVYVEEGENPAELKACSVLLHQVQGTLRMVELYGAAMVAEEMEQLAKALHEGKVDKRDEAYAVLMQGIVQLPDYLERLQSGHRDIPIVLLPLLNQLREARGEKGLAESVLFSPDLSRPLPASAQGPAQPLPQDDLRRRAEALRGLFQGALLRWLKDDNSAATLKDLTDVCEQLVPLTAAEPARRLFWVAAGTLDALGRNAFPVSKPLKQALAKVEREIKRLADGGDSAFRNDPPIELTKQLLYFVAHEGSDEGRIGEIRQVFGLADHGPSEAELAHARGSLTGHNRALLETVSAALKEDLLRVKDALDLHLRTENAPPAALMDQVEALDRVADTLGMLGLGVPRRVVQEQRTAIHDVVSGTRKSDEATLLDIAGALLYVEASLDDQVERLGQGEAEGAGERPLPSTEARKVLDVLVKEAIGNFAQARQCFVAFVETHWDHAQLTDVPRLLDEVGGALRILDLPQPSEYLTAVRRFTESELLRRRRVPNGQQMDRLADALASLEYFLEALRDRRPNREQILDVARQSLEALGYWPLPPADELPAMPIAEAAKPAPAASAPAAPSIPGPPPPVEAPAPVAEAAPPAPAPAPAPAAPVAAAPAPAPVPSAAVATAVVAAGDLVPGFDAGGNDEIDDEIREVFLEEFEEEIGNLDQLLPPWRAAPANAELLRPIRRVFHTLKGSGRLVGAKALGEFSWKIESMLNRVLDGTRPASPGVVGLIEHAFNVLPLLRAALMGERVHADLAGIEAAADRLAAGEEIAYSPSPLAAAAAEVPSVATAAVAEVATPGPAVVAVEATSMPAAEVSSEQAFAIDPVLFEILKPEVAGHLETVDAWLAQCTAHGPQAPSDALLRSIHTMNGAFAMTEVEVITDVTAPVESFIKRAIAHRAAPDQESVTVIRDTAAAIRETIAALERPNPTLPNFDALAARARELRDLLPDATMPAALAASEHEEATGLMPQAVMLETPDVSGIPEFTAAETAVGAEAIAPVEAASDSLETAARAEAAAGGDEVPPTAEAPVEAAPAPVETAVEDEAPVETELISLEDFAVAEAAGEPEFALEEAAPALESPTGFEITELAIDAVEPTPEAAEPVMEAVPATTEPEHVPLPSADADDALAAMIAAYAAEAPAPEPVVEAAADIAVEPEPAVESLVTDSGLGLDSTPYDEAAEAMAAGETVPSSEAMPAAAELELVPATVADEEAQAESEVEHELPPEAETAAGDEFYGMSLEELEAATAPAGAAEVAASAPVAPSIEAEPTFEAEPVFAPEPAFASEPTREPEAEPSFESEPAVEEAVEEPSLQEAILAASDLGALEEPATVPAPVATSAASIEAVSAELAGAGVVPVAEDPADPDEPLDTSDMDPDLLDIFLEESHDILDHSDGLLAKLRDASADKDLITNLQRDLHTLKGGARMAGIYPVGELGHSMESLLEAVAEGRRSLDERGIVVLERGFDRLHSMVGRISERKALALPAGLIAQFEALALGRSLADIAAAADAAAPAAPAAPTPTKLDRLEAARELAPVPVPAPAAAPAAVVGGGLKPLSAPIDALAEEDEMASVRAPQEQVRIRADLLDRLVNYAGEVAIYRARLEQQLGAFRTNLGELNQTTSRLREQLRRLDIETEAQIMARYQREDENDDETFDPLELDRFTNQQQLSRGLAESANDLVNLQTSLDDLVRQYETLLLQQSRVSSDLQEGLMRTRMVPFDALVPRLRRVLRQASSDTGKQAQLKVDGAAGEMDRNVLDRMTAPLEHMLRNSMAHGLESPADRRKAGKPEEGTVRIALQREGSEVVLRISDDGRGLNKAAIRKKAIEKGLIAADADLGDEAIYALILEAGFSTAETVTRLAGRGVGMDVVYSEIRQLGGSLQIRSNEGKGSEFIIRLPFTLAVTQAVFVKIGETSFAVPIASVQGVGRIARSDLDKQLASEHPVYSYAGEDYAIHDLGTLIGHASAKAQDSLQMPLLLARSGDLRAAICIDQVLGSREIVVKPVGPQVNSVPGIFGATIMGDGRVVVILDVAPLVRRHAALLRDETPIVPAQPVVVQRVPAVMVVDDSITMRKVTGRVLERHNMEVLTAKDGVDAVEKMAERVPDLVLLDIEMPRMDGYEVAQNMRSDPRLKDVPIIMITSRTGEKHRQRAMDIGVNRYLGKPYQENELMRNVFEMLGMEPVNG